MPEFQTTINSITTPESWGKPRFSFGDLVKWEWMNHESHGVILGLYYSPEKRNNEIKGWHYVVKNIRSINTVLNSDCFMIENEEIFQESDLIPVSAPNPVRGIYKR
ncbi:MAG: hypothetical protein KME46_32675 [Brasilonema angustatum HA4187-MV1]|jgi:hypothetical protein|nr:hypothetical protein [Brasilonema angustatum HA4187-MV1]